MILYLVAVAICCTEFFAVSLPLLGVFHWVSPRDYHGTWEPLRQSLLFALFFVVLGSRGGPTWGQLRLPKPRLIALVGHALLVAAGWWFLWSMLRRAPLPPLAEDSLWLRLARLGSPLAGPFMIRVRLMTELLWIGALISLCGVWYHIERWAKWVGPAFLGSLLFGEYFFIVLPNQVFWPLLQKAVAAAQYANLRLLPLPCLILKFPDGLAPIVGTCRFNVSIAFQCSGLEGIAFYWLTLATALWIDRKVVVRTRALLLAIYGSMVMWLLNHFRILALILIGHYYDPRLAVNVWHGYSGMVLYILGIGLLLKTSYSRVLKTRNPR